MPDFLLEIGVEEVPDGMITHGLQNLKKALATECFGGSFPSEPLLMATPRRLAIQVRNLPDKLDDYDEVLKGPPKSAGQKAAAGFAKKQGIQIDDLTDQGEYYILRRKRMGAATFDSLRSNLAEVITQIHWPKTMYWTGRDGVRFIRPIRWILALLGPEVIPFEVAGVRSGNTTRGHRILGSRDPLPVTVMSYPDVLLANFVIVHAEDRKRRIQDQLGVGVQKDQELLRTLVYLTEYPTAIRGSFDPSYLELPREILSTVMRHHQRYFSVVKEDGSLAPEFVAVTNTDGDPDGLIRQGNERVLRARFNDARFFWKVDQEKKLAERGLDLQSVTFHAKLGNYAQKTLRVELQAETLAVQSGASAQVMRQAAQLCKADLTTSMVKEFPELQGIVGGLYAKAQGEGEAVWRAIYDHYKPVNMEDTLPQTLEGQILSLADKLDTLRECFKIGMIPTGSKDPFALRRAAQGVVKILFEAKLPLQIREEPKLQAFLLERIQFYLRDILGYPYDEVNAVLGPPFTTMPDLALRAEAVRNVRPTGDFEPLAASFKRIKNILRDADYHQILPLKTDMLLPGPEKDLYLAYSSAIHAVRSTGSYREKLLAIAAIRPHVDLFFNKILVNDPNPQIRENRLRLLRDLFKEFSTIADFSEIVTQGVGDKT